MLHMQSKALSNEATLVWLTALQVVSCCLYLVLSHSDVCVTVEMLIVSQTLQVRLGANVQCI